MSNPLDILIPSNPPPRGDYVEWATVASVNPLKVALDSDDGNVLAVSPCSVTVGLEPGHRVLVVRHGRTTSVLGAAGGVNLLGTIEGALDDRLEDYVPWEEPGWRVLIGNDDADDVPALELRRKRPDYNPRLSMYIAAHASVPEFAIRLFEGDDAASGLYVSADGNMSMQTYGASTSPSAARPIPFAVAAGSASVTASDGIGYTRVTLPSGRFTQTPIILALAHSAATTISNVQASSPSSTSFDLYMQRSNSVSTGVWWLAIQMTADSAGG